MLRVVWAIVVLVVVVVAFGAIRASADDASVAGTAPVVDVASAPVGERVAVEPRSVPGWTFAGDMVAPPGEVAPVVNTSGLAMLFTLGASEDGTLTAPYPEVGEWTLGLGPYLVTLDPDTRTALVTGPEGADVLQRDIDRALFPLPAGVEVESVGVWTYAGTDAEHADAAAWRYEDTPLVRYDPAAESGATR